MPELLATTTSRELAEFMAYYKLLAEDSRPGSKPIQHVSGDAAFDVMEQAATKRRG